MGKPCLLETQKEISVFINKMILCLEFASKSEKSCVSQTEITLDFLSFTNGYFYKINYSRGKMKDMN